jgi:hypothetical protein
MGDRRWWAFISPHLPTPIPREQLVGQVEHSGQTSRSAAGGSRLVNVSDDQAT